MQPKKKEPPRAKEPATRAEHLRQHKGLSLPQRIAGHRTGAAIPPRPTGPGRKG